MLSYFKIHKSVCFIFLKQEIGDDVDIHENMRNESNKVRIDTSLGTNQSGVAPPGLQLSSRKLRRNGLENIELVADLDLAIFLQKWYYSLGEFVDDADNTEAKRNRSLKNPGMFCQVTFPMHRVAFMRLP